MSKLSNHSPLQDNNRRLAIKLEREIRNATVLQAGGKHFHEVFVATACLLRNVSKGPRVTVANPDGSEA